MRPVALIGQMVVTLALLILGFKLATVKFTAFRSTVIASVIRLGVGLTLGFAMVQIFHLTGILRAVVLFDSMMPAARAKASLARLY